MRWIILILSISLFVSGVVLSFQGDTRSAIATYSAGIISLFFVFLTQFKKFKGFGFEGELWEDKMEEAEELIKGLRSLSVAVSKPIISTIIRMGHWGGALSNKDKLDMVKQIESALKDNNIPGDKVEEALRDWHRFNVGGLTGLILRDISDYLNKKREPIEAKRASIPTPINPSDPEFIKCIEDLRTIGEAASKIKPIYSMETPEAFLQGFESILNDPNIFSEGERNDFIQTHKEEIEDLKYYVKNKQFRRLDHWLAQDEKEK